MKKKYHQLNLLSIALFMFFLVGGIKTAFSQSNTAKVCQTITSRIVKNLTNNKPDNKLVAANIAAIKPDGTWPGVDYASKSITIWPPTEHLIKLQTLIKAYLTKNSGFYADAKVFQHINNALQYWYNLDPKSDNWWFNEIYTPQSLGESLIMMEHGDKKLDKELKLKLVERMKRGNPEKQAGANKTDIALHYFYRALLTEDETLLTFSLKEFFSPISLVYKKEGLQYDNSYMQHGLQLYIAGYGDVFINSVFKLANYVKETPYALSADKVALLSNFYRNTFLKAIRGEYADFNIEGRRISRFDMLNLEKQIESGQILKASPQILIAKEVDPKNAVDWDSAIARITGQQGPSYNVKKLHTQYFNSDYTLHVRPGYSFNVRMVSNRTKRCESGNNENLLGRYLSDGATNIQVNGPEYYNIMPVWEWDKIPGVTSRDYATDRPMTVFWGEQGSNDFAGGVSDGVYGASTYALGYDSVKAKKSWFFFDNEIMCLGTGIKSNEPESITTAINQCWLKGNVESSLSRNPIAKDKTIQRNEKLSTWFLHDNVGYYFPQGGNITLSTSVQKGNWYHINNSQPKDELSGNVFKLWLNHGSKPQNASYAYIVLPGIKDATSMKKFEANNLKIIANNPAMQAVYHQKLNILQAIFYQPGTLTLSSMEIKTDKACALMIKMINGKRLISVADPLQKEKIATLSLKDLKTGKKDQVTVNFPEGALAGSTVEIRPNIKNEKNN